ncbi:MAG: sugar phosphate isomerase/epimerase [Planctomycetota bacterium]|nr:sugar phosphate isomerase/epimerase [Planctomycetota bacterium]
MSDQSLFRISIAQWSLHRMHFADELDPLDFPTFTNEEFGLEGVEYVNIFFKDKATDFVWLDDLKSGAADAGVESLIIMVDREGDLGHPSDEVRRIAVENHYQWVDAAKFLGCHSIRVNAKSEGSYEDQQKLAADGLRQLTQYASTKNINVLVENHGGLSSNGQWLSGVMKLVDHPRCGTLPDFGNFCLDWDRRDDPDMWYDKYQGVEELMPYAKAVSAKSNEFDAEGKETNIDYERMMKIVRDANYRGWVGVEYEGEDPDEVEGVKKTMRLLERVRESLS